MADGLNIKVNAKLDVGSTTKQIQTQLSEVAKNIQPIQLNAKIDTDSIKQQTQQIQSQINSAVSNTSSNTKPISLDNVFKFDTHNMTKLMEQLTVYKNELSKLSDISPAKLSTHTNSLGNIDSAKFTYFNDRLKSSVTEVYELDKASKEANSSVNRLALTGTTYSTNAYNAAQQTEKFSQQLQAFKTTVNSFGDKNVGTLLDSNSLGTQYQKLLTGLDSVKDNNGLNAVKNQFKDLQAQTISYIQDQRTLKTEVNNTTNSQIKDFEILTKSEQQRQAEIQKTSNKIEELTADYNKFQAQLSKNNKGISLDSLNQENISGLQGALNSNNIQQTTHFLRLLKTEYSELNEAMDKPFSSNALEKFESRAQKLSQDIEIIKSKFSNINLGGMSGFSGKVSQVSQNVSQLKTNLDNFNKAQVGQEKVQAFNTLNSSVKETKKQVNDLFKAQQALANVDITSNKFESYLKENSRVADKFPTKVNAIRTSLKSLGNETDTTKLTTGLQNVNKQFSNLKTSAEKAGIEGRTALQEIGNDLKKMFYWTVGGTAIFGTINKIKQGIGIVNSLNTSMTNIQMITGMSATQVGELTKQYSDLASQLHETTTSIMGASEEFLRAGNNAQETASLLKASTVMSKIAGQSQEESAQSLISIMNAYHLKATDMMGVTDKLVAVDNVSATSTAELSEAIQKTAASAQSSGVSFSQLVSWIGEVSSVSRQSADTIGTAFNSIFSRYEKVKAGANTDDQGEAVNDVEKVLKKFDISIRDQSNNFINFNTVLTEVAQKWSTLNTVEQGQISTAIAGLKVA